MYAIHKAEQELAVENHLSENRGRPATIPTVKHADHEPPGIAQSCKKEHAQFANDCRAKPRSHLSPCEERAALLGELTRDRGLVPSSVTSGT